MNSGSESLSPMFLELLNTIGVPTVIEGIKRNADKQLMQLAKINKVALLYSLACGQESKDLMDSYRLLIDTLREVSAVFNSNGITYSIFKTIKPFPSTPADIDILISDEHLNKAISLLESSGYKRTEYDAYNVPLKREMIIDLQLQPSVSNLPYLRKQFLMQNTILDNAYGVSGYNLNTAAEIIMIASHSIYKEQMFTLNDYYTITILAESVDVSDLLKSAELSNSLEALRIILSICAQITETAFGKKLRVCELADAFGASYRPIPRNLPLKFPIPLVIRLLISKASKEEEMRRMIMPAIIRIASPRQLLSLVTHLTRKTY
jgi:hypothetical protein